jgi:hypothetical protein
MPSSRLDTTSIRQPIEIYFLSRGDEACECDPPVTPRYLDYLIILIAAAAEESIDARNPVGPESHFSGFETKFPRSKTSRRNTMTTLVNITRKTPHAVQIWGFHDPCDVDDVAAALNTIAAGLSGDGHTIHVMSGTHGYCKGQVGAVATREQKFAQEDRSLASPKTKDNKAVAIVVHDFNTGKLPAPDYVTAAMAKLNADMRAIVGSNPGTATFLLAYCCSAGTP